MSLLLLFGGVGIAAPIVVAAGDEVTTANAVFARTVTAESSAFARDVTGQNAPFVRTITSAKTER